MKVLEQLAFGWRGKRKLRKLSYAQCGEDLLLHFLLVELLGLNRPTYLDIGAHDPIRFSNTYLFYTLGGRGVCVEPDPILLQRIRRRRPIDTCLNVGIGEEDGACHDFFVMSEKSLNTFSCEDAQQMELSGLHRIERVLQIPVMSVNTVVSKHFNSPPNLVSLDTEGNDLTILKAFDFGNGRPEAFCVETLTYPDERRVVEIVEYMERVGYYIYADTYLNTIFVDGTAWHKRQKGQPLRIRMQR